MSSSVLRKADNIMDSQRKRRKGAARLSCAECRRLKLRCDRQIPCSSCVKRGCGAICPDISLTTGQGNRFVLASTQELHEKISELAQRVRELEDALRTSHAQLSNDLHPLLSEDLLKIKMPLQREANARTGTSSNGGNQKTEEQNPDVVDAFGSLSLGLSGRSKYYGQIANSWYFLQNEAGEEEVEVIDDRLIGVQNLLPVNILNQAAAMLISPPATSAGQLNLQSLYCYLPNTNRASELCLIYFRHAAWMYNPIHQDAFDYDIFQPFYDPNSVLSDDPLVFQRLSVLFIVLAIGTLMDTSQPAYNIEAEKYNQLAKAALFQSPFFDAPSTTVVQALFLMTYYLFLSDRHGSANGVRWTLMGIAVKVAQSIGLHRDSGRWQGIDPLETQRRRELFWELFTYDSWQCLTFGRPPSFALPHLDCKLPFPSDQEENSFHSWKHRFTSECMNLLHDQAFGAKSPTYATILQLDRKLRAFPVPASLQVAGFGNSEAQTGGQETVMLALQRHIVLAIREANLLYLHRSFFARAISDHPKDPLGSPYGTSVIAAYRSAGSLIALMRNLHTQLKEPSERIWFLWTHMFSCAIVLGSIVTRCPSMSLAPSALVQLDSACDLFSKAARGFRATKVLNIMLNLQERAHVSLEEFRKGRTARVDSEPGSPADEDELAMLGGKTRLVKKEPSSPQMLDRSPISNNPVVPFPLNPSSESQVDPNVLVYLSSFGSYPQSISQSSSHYSDPDNSPVALYGMTPLPSPFHEHAYGGQQQQSQLQSSPTQGQTFNMPINGNTSINGGSNAFPQYFPVYDYGAVPMSNGYSNSTILDLHPAPQRRSSSGSPEANTIHTTWQDFVNGLDVNGMELMQ